MRRNQLSIRIGRFGLMVAAVAAASGLRAEPSAKAGRHMSYYEVRRGLFALSKIKTAPIVMLGDSLTEAGPWTDLTGCLSIANRGIGGDTTAKLRDRLDDIVALHPRAIFLMIGVNDITLNVPGDATAANLRAILDRLGATDAHLFVSYVLPVAARYPKKRVNKEIPKLNDVIAKLTAGRPRITMIEARPSLGGADGYLREEFSYDGLHLTPKGYAVLRDAIAPYVAKYCVP
jgi:lysophospholipase L1-like esterase